jgi:hypothetical protein
MSAESLNTANTLPPPRRLRFGLGKIFLATAIVAAILAAIYNLRAGAHTQAENQRLSAENESLRSELAAMKLEVKLQRLEEDLKVPNAALFRLYFPWGEFNAKRFEALERFGVDRFAPYYDVVHHGREPPFDYLQGFPEDPRWALNEDKRTNQGSFIEGFHINFPRGACVRLLNSLRRDAEFRAYLDKDPGLFQKRLRPLLLRLAMAPETNWRYLACEALLEMGDRSAPLMEVLRRSLARPAMLPDDVRYPDPRWIEFSSYDPKEAQRLVAQYDLSSLINLSPENIAQ